MKTSTKQTHTPGPWRAEFPDRGVMEMSSIYAPANDGDAPWRVAYVLRETNPGQRLIDDANAHLIAAAPELLDLVRRFARGDMRLPHSEYDMELRKEARALVAKAEGRS
jgi:hypothetical protein